MPVRLKSLIQRIARLWEKNPGGSVRGRDAFKKDRQREKRDPRLACKR